MQIWWRQVAVGAHNLTARHSVDSPPSSINGVTLAGEKRLQY